MSVKFTNQEMTSAVFNGVYFSLSSPEDWDSIGDGPTRDAVKAWLAAGNVPEQMDPPNPNDAVLTQIAELESTITQRRMREAVLGIDNGWLHNMNDQIAALRAMLVK